MESGKESQEWNRASGTILLTLKKLPRHFNAHLQQSRSPKMNELPTLNSMFSVQAGQDKMFNVKYAELQVGTSELNDCVSFEKVDWTFQGDFRTGVQFENE